jgi:acetylornithine aminotransferase/acetylornithine/N-succinyldiaminopimelate aminotransferase
MAGLVLDGPAGEVVKACLERGLLVNATADRVLRMTPPLVVTQGELDDGLSILDAALA